MNVLFLFSHFHKMGLVLQLYLFIQETFSKQLLSDRYYPGTRNTEQSRLKHGSRNLYYRGKGLDMVLRPFKAKHQIQDLFQKRIIMRTLDAHHPILLPQLQRQKSRSRNSKYFIQGHTGSYPLYLGVQPLSSNLFYI